jgi:hypothetical protein
MTGSDRRGIVLQERDRHLLREVSIMRVIDRPLAATVAGFRSIRRTNARLQALHQAGLLRRFFQGTRAGGKKAFYTLSGKGARLIDVASNGLRRGKDEVVVADLFLAHQMGINEVYCALKYRPDSRHPSPLVRWLTFTESPTPPIALIPDGYCELSSPEGALAVFLEVDLGHEGAPVWRKKVANYLRLAVSGIFTERFKHPQFRVIVVVSSDRRLSSLREVIRSQTDRIFWFSTLEAIRQQGVWGPIWFRPVGDHPVFLR